MALVLTLAFIVIIMLFSLTLLYQVTNTSKQVSLMEKNIEARHMAEMGLDYYNQFIRSEKEFLETVNRTELVSELNHLNDNLMKEINIENDDRYFKIQDLRIKESNENELIISFTSIGKAFEESVPIDSEIT